MLMICPPRHRARRRPAAEELAAEIQIEQSIVLRERCRREGRALEPRRAIAATRRTARPDR
jgi:hypothetical protein